MAATAQPQPARGSPCDRRFRRGISASSRPDGRGRGREMVLHLAERLDVPLRERNRLLLAAGFAPVFGERSLDEERDGARPGGARAVPGRARAYPAVVVDRHWNVVASNRGVAYVNRDVAPELRAPPARRAPDRAAPGWPGAADLESRRLERLPARAAAPRDRSDRRSRAGSPLRRARRLPRSGRGGRSRETYRRRTRSCSGTSSASTTGTSPSSARSPLSERRATSHSPSSRSWPSTRPTRKPREALQRRSQRSRST